MSGCRAWCPIFLFRKYESDSNFLWSRLWKIYVLWKSKFFHSPSIGKNDRIMFFHRQEKKKTFFTILKTRANLRKRTNLSSTYLTNLHIMDEQTQMPSVQKNMGNGHGAWFFIFFSIILYYQIHVGTISYSIGRNTFIRFQFVCKRISHACNFIGVYT